MVGKAKSTKSLYSSALSDSESVGLGGHSEADVYSHSFMTKPFGMEWKTTKTDKKNLYVSKVAPNSQAEEGGVLKGSKLVSFNGVLIENMGAKKIYAKLSQAELPLTITFLKPKSVEKMEKVKSDSAGDQDADGTPEPPRVSSKAPPADSPKSLESNDSGSGFTRFCALFTWNL